MARLLMRRPSRSLLVLCLALLGFAATGGRAHAALMTPGAVFTETNDPAGNSVLAFTRAGDGTLTPAGSYPTGGLGSAGTGPLGLPPLDGAGPVQLTRDGDNRDCLFAVNAGSNTVSSFRVNPSGLQLASVAPTNGDRPTSVTSTQRGDGVSIMYVLNASHAGSSIQGYWVSPWCTLTPIPGSNRPTFVPATFAAQISFGPRGDVLAVSERFTNLIDIYPIDRSGAAGAPTPSPAANDEPYGLAWRVQGGGDVLTVSEGGGLNIAGSTASTYRLVGTTLVHISSQPSPGAACWDRVTNNGKFLYVSNPAAGFDPFGTGTPVPGTGETAYTIGRDGTLTPDGGAATSHSATDNALSHNSRYLYVLSNSLFEGLPVPVSAINEFRVDQQTGALTPIGSIEGIPSNTVSGLAAW